MSSKNENTASIRFEEKYGRLRIAVHNINGLKNNQHRLQELIDFGESLDLDIIGIVETNIKEKEARYINISSNKYSCWWSSAEQGKHKGSGVGILVSKTWSEHLTEIRRHNAYTIRATFSFRRTKLIVWVVYIPPSDKRMQKEIQRLVTKDISGKKGETQYIIGGDFNKILDQNLDTTNLRKKGRNPQLPLIKWIQTLGYREVFRSINPDLKKYTWSNGKVKTRIDQIWVSTRIKEGLQKSDIEEMDLVTGSDHNLIWGEIRTPSFLDHSISNRSKANLGKIPVRRIYFYEKASEENWENYKNTVDNFLKKNNKADETEKADALRNLTQKEVFINNEWDRIVNAINRAAAKHIPSKLSKRTRVEMNKQASRNPKYQDIKTLKRITKRIRDRHHNSEDEIDIFLWNCQIQEINTRHEVQVQEIDLLTNEDWIQDTRGWIRTLENKIHKEEQLRNEKVIVENIERRYGLIGKRDKQMLNSILERPSKSLLIEKVLIEAKSTVCNSELVINPELVKEQIDIHFQKQFSKRKHKFESLTEEWEEEYSPKRWIQQDWYEEVMAEVTEEDWRESLSAAKANTAPGISGISYTLIRRVGPIATKAFLFLVNTILEAQIFPRKWKIGQIFPIPKMAEWDLMLGSTRPIMLLETCRKTLVRIIQKRLSKVLVEHKILRGMNFAGLPGESTCSPIHIINNLLEDAKQKNKEIWVLLQDIKKAFDSVSMESIKLALIRIRVPENLISFIIEIFNGRQAQVITKYGLTKGFQAEDGIDQGEVISPLVWRIIYDPLLTKLRDMGKGYTLSVNWPVHVEMRKERKLSSQIAAVAYADDTTFIADSKNSLQQIINKAQEFYDLNDIEINPKKSELLVLNREKGKTYSITLGEKKEEIKAKKVEDTVRLLGVWIGGKNQKKMCRIKLQQEVRTFTQLIRAKRISIEQIKYLNNKVLLPRLEYRSMIFLWSKRACDKIHQPMLRLAKWKAGLASTCSNALLTHKDLLGFRSFWQRHTESMITEWMIRLNDSEALGQTCLLRLREAQLEACDPDPIWDTSSISFENKAFQNNLNMEILFAAKSLKITVQTDHLEENWSFACGNKSNFKIINLLYESNWTGSLESLKSLKVWYIGQLIDTQGKSLLTWQQLRKLQGLGSAGKKASWFNKIEELVLEENTGRHVRRVYQRKAYNTLTTEFQFRKVSEKRSKKEWVLSENDKENEFIVGKVKKKTGSHLDISPWLRINRDNFRENKEQEIRLQQISESSLVRLKKNSAQDITKWVNNKEEEKVLGIQLYHMTDFLDRRKGEIRKKERDMEEVTVRIENWDRVVIKKVIKEEWKQVELLEALEENREELDLVFFTDGSYRSKRYEQKSSLGYGIVQISKQNTVIRDIKGSLERWFSSTRPELRAILDTILIAPSGSKVTINTDSKAAIGAVQSALSTNKARAWFRTTNSTILSAIKEAVASKAIQLCLVKVKAHSGLLWNDRADKLAKEGLDSDLISESREITSRGQVYKPLWQNTSIEVPLRDFIKKVTNTIYKVEWTFLRANKDQRHRDRLGNKDWSVFRLFLRRLEKAQSRTIKEDLKRSFVLKCINRALPTLEKRRMQRPDMYSSAICIKCLEEVETFEHLTECSQDEILWLEGEKNIVEDIWMNSVSETERDFSELALHEALIPEAHKRTIWRSKLARGILENQYRESLQALGLSKSKARILLSIFLEKWLTFFQNSIWKIRCSRIIEWEKTLNIKYRDKRKKKARKKPQGKEKKARKKSVVSEGECINVREKEWNQTLESAFKEISKWIEKDSFSAWNSR